VHGRPVGSPLSEHDHGVNAMAVGRLGNRDVIVSGGGDGAVRVWDEHGGTAAALPTLIRTTRATAIAQRKVYTATGVSVVAWEWLAPPGAVE